MGDREALSIPSFEDDLDDFEPRRAGQGRADARPSAKPVSPRATEARKAVDAVSSFPSREASQDAQLNLKGPRHILDRFRAMCKADRRSYYDMLEILMDRFDEKD